MKAIWNNEIIAEAPREELVYIEQNWYFPPSSVKKEYLQESPTPYTCPWKGVCQYYNVINPSDPTAVSEDNAWAYLEPYESAITKVKKDFSGYVAFWRDVTVTE